MAFRFASGALKSGNASLGASAKARRIVYDVGSHDSLVAPESDLTGALQVGSTWFISGAVQAEASTVSGVATVSKLPKFASGDLQAERSTVVGIAAQEVNQEGEAALQASRATVSATVNFGLSASGSLQAGIFRTQGQGTVARRLLTGSGELRVETRATVSGSADRVSTGSGALTAAPSTVIATTNLDRLVLHTAIGALHSLRATVNGVSSKWVIGWGDLQAGRSTVFGSNFRATFADPARVTFAVEPQPILKTGVGGSLRIVATPQTLEVGRPSCSFTINADEDFEPMPEAPKTTESDVIVFELPECFVLFHVEPAPELKAAHQPTVNEVEPTKTIWHPEVKAA